MKKILSGLVLALALFSCGGSSDTEKSTLAYNISQEGKTLDSSLATTSTSIEILGKTSEGLTKVGKNLGIEAGLAKSWDISEDGLTWTFHLRDGIKWSNGDPITAEDFKFAWLRALDSKTASEYAYMLFYIKGGEEFNKGDISADEVGIKAIDDKTLEVTLKNVVPYFESLLSFATYLPINEKFLKEQGDEYALEPENLLSSGAYKIVEWSHNSNMVFEKNDNYYNKDEIKLDKIVVKFINDPNSELSAYKNGELDFAKLSGEQYEEYKNDDKLFYSPDAVTYYLEYNTTMPLLSNKKIRQAITLSIDKENISENIYNGTRKAIYTLTPKGLGTDASGEKDFVDAIGDVVPKYNPTEAKKLFDEGLKELGLEKAPVVSLLMGGDPITKKLGAVIQENLRINLGLEVNVEGIAFKERVARMNTKNFEIVLAGWGPDYKDPMTFLDLFVTNGGNNHSSFSNARYDELVNIAKSTTDKAKRFEAFKEMEEILADEMPIGVLVNRNNFYLINKDVKGLVFPVMGPSIVTNYAEKVK